MSDVLAKAAEHFKGRVDNEVQSIEVPEWETTIHFRPISLKSQDCIYRLSRENDLTALAETLIVRALDADGKPMFKKTDRVRLMREVDPAIINRIVMAMAEDETTDGEAEKN